VFLMHGFPYDIHAYADVVPRWRTARGCRVIVPYLRGFGPTRFLSPDTPRSGEQAALGADLLALMDALAVPRAVLAGYDWGGRAACVVAALWPERCAGLLSFNSYNIQNIARRCSPTPRERAQPVVPVLLPQRTRARRPGAGPARRVPPAVATVVAHLGASTTPPSTAARPPSTTPTSSTW
jgi:pimeloyl-ACP methyl ester carboxylesterase